MTDADTIIIGSGSGGLTAAVALAQAPQRVLVLEQHEAPGGWSHSFSRGGYRFSPGVHYIGELGSGEWLAEIYGGLGIAQDVVFLELNPDGYEHVWVGTEKVDFPKGREALAERLGRRFPPEARGIASYLATIELIAARIDAAVRRGHRHLLTLPDGTPAAAEFGGLTLQQLIARFIRDPLLADLLAVQCGDHGMLPEIAPATAHAAVASHYFEGAYYPLGGGAGLVRALSRSLRRAGGELRLRSPVAQILIEGGRASGVRLVDGTVLRADAVLSNADPAMTFGRLIAAESQSAALRHKVEQARYSVSAVHLFAVVEMDLAGMGFDSGNYWQSQEIGSGGCLGLTRTPPHGSVDDLPGLILSVSSLKDRTSFDGRHHTIEATVFVPHDLFAPWQNELQAPRPEAYQALKERLRRSLIAAAERVIPGFEAHLRFAEVGTPVTSEQLVRAHHGCAYGIDKRFGQIGRGGFDVKTEIPGLFLCGASTVAHGVMGAAVSGLMAAQAICGCAFAQLFPHAQSVTVLPSDDPGAWPAEYRRRLRA